jgi:hypothetical protein
LERNDAAPLPIVPLKVEHFLTEQRIGHSWYSATDPNLCGSVVRRRF